MLDRTELINAAIEYDEDTVLDVVRELDKDELEERCPERDKSR